MNKYWVAALLKGLRTIKNFFIGMTKRWARPLNRGGRVIGVLFKVFYLRAWVPLFRSIAFIHIICVRGDLYQPIQTDAATTKRAARVCLRRLDDILYTPPAEHVSAVRNHWDSKWIQANRALLIRSWTQKGDKCRYQLLTEFLWGRTVLRVRETEL